MSEQAPTPSTAASTPGLPEGRRTIFDDPEALKRVAPLRLAETKKRPPVHELVGSFYGKLEGIQGEQADPFEPIQTAMESGVTTGDVAKTLMDGGVTLDEVDAAKVIRRDEIQSHLKGNGGDGDEAAIDKGFQETGVLSGIMEEMVAARVEGWDETPERQTMANKMAEQKGEPLPFPELREEGERKSAAIDGIINAGKSAEDQAKAEPVNPEQTTQPEGMKFKARTFEEAEKLKKGFSDQFIDGFLDDELKGATGETTLLKNYLDQVPATAEDAEFVRNPDSMSDIHEQIRDMIADHLKIAVAPGTDPRAVEFLSGKKQDYLEKLRAGSEAAKRFFHDVVDRSKRVSTRDISLGHISVPTEKGEVDILSAKESVPGVRPNIRIQEELAGEFVHWSTDKYVLAKVRGELKDSDTTKRIYLNPSAEDSVKLFTVIMTTANEAGMKVHGKMLDRSLEAAGETRRAARGDAISHRADGIVMYVSDAEADALLSMVEAISKDTPDTFKGRSAAKIPIKIAEGIAVGSEPVTEKGTTESLTSHREKLLHETKEETKKQLGVGQHEKIPPQLTAQARKVFRDRFRQVAAKHGVNADNFAFN